MNMEPGDIVLVSSPSWISRAIRWFERSPGEARSKASHVGIIVEGGPLESAVIVEALTTVKRHGLQSAYAASGATITVRRMPGITQAHQQQAALAAESYVGRKYGYLKIAAHAMDRGLSWLTLGAWKSPFVFRRLAMMDKYPICSWVVAFSYAEFGATFGIAPEACDPDDIDDATLSWIEVMPWTKI
jgi:hypothetical protein